MCFLIWSFFFQLSYIVLLSNSFYMSMEGVFISSIILVFLTAFILYGTCLLMLFFLQIKLVFITIFFIWYRYFLFNVFIWCLFFYILFISYAACFSNSGDIYDDRLVLFAWFIQMCFLLQQRSQNNEKCFVSVQWHFQEYFLF